MEQRLAVIDGPRAIAGRRDRPARPTARPGSAAAARTTPAPACPKARARGRHRLPLHDHLDARPQHQHLHADGRRGRDLGGAGAVHHGQHVFANLGDGTYFHSGLLAIRQSIAAGTNITYKVLYNDAVAMTGGQRVGERPEGHSVLQIMNSLLSEGVAKLVIVTDEPRNTAQMAWREAPGRERPRGIVHHRDELDASSASSARSRAARPSSTTRPAPPKSAAAASGTWPDKTVVINELVCEGCGDCSVQSNCLSVEPVETEFGRKRRINQNSCNKDYSCVKGFCPSFVTVEGGSSKSPSRRRRASLSALPPFPSRCCPWPSRPGASWWPVSAARA
jgi:TPP-dependent indolepyruvate ferredoxin oxidoreductase alpha subunit